MQAKSVDTLFESERKHTEAVYAAFDEIRSNAASSMDRAASSVNAGAYEEQDAFVQYQELNAARTTLQKTEQLLRALYTQPYFAHIETEGDNPDESEHFYLSDNETLDQILFIGSSGYLLPFRRDSKRPVTAALYRCYTAGTGEAVPYQGSGGETFTCTPLLICNDDIYERKLRSVTPIYPKMEASLSNIDELLQKMLDANRKDAALKNIIQTLQQQQFAIIDADPETSFVVQGCAGSGKSQCLLHRLFYLRGELSDNNWAHVLMLTPTQLFRNYSADLMRRFQLSDIKNCSLADLYRELLELYDSRFRDRQYVFELSEEYLPDAYLQVVYGSETMQKIDAAITSGIAGYVQAACEALQIPAPEVVTGEVLTALQQQLDEQIELADSLNQILQEDEEYIQTRTRREELQKELQKLQRQREKAASELEKQKEKVNRLRTPVENLQNAKTSRDDWRAKTAREKESARAELTRLEKQLKTPFPLHLPAVYAHQLGLVRQMESAEWQEEEAAYLQILDEDCLRAEEELRKITKSLYPERQLSQNVEKQAKLAEQLAQLKEQIQALTADADACAAWMQAREFDVAGEQNQLTARRTAMVRARYDLRRLEVSVFENEVWDALAPIKEKYGIQAIQIERSENESERRSRILYKSDLLFYIKIYEQLNSDMKLPDYAMICIDEGQDLHRVDYDLLRRLFPAAVFNIFGDTAQVLHSACGVADWQSDTGIQNVYTLTHNYRNTPAVVQFCQQRFGADMEAVGSAQPDQRPTVVTGVQALRAALNSENMTVILKNRQAFENLCTAVGMDASQLEYLDTRAEKPAGGKIPCYSVFAAKGLEFQKVLVDAEGMTDNQQVVACTRAMETLYYYE